MHMHAYTRNKWLKSYLQNLVNDVSKTRAEAQALLVLRPSLSPSSPLVHTLGWSIQGSIRHAEFSVDASLDMDEDSKKAMGKMSSSYKLVWMAQKKHLDFSVGFAKFYK